MPKIIHHFFVVHLQAKLNFGKIQFGLEVVKVNKKNDSLTDDHTLQRQFTIYLRNAAHIGERKFSLILGRYEYKTKIFI